MIGLRRLDNLQFCKGWFRDTLPKVSITQLAVLRLGGDMYESKMDSLVNLYPKLSIGGYIIVDDYDVLPPCRLAVEDYRKSNDIHKKIQRVDYGQGIYWQRLNK